MEKSNETKSCFFEKINTIERPLAQLKRRKKRRQITKNRKEEVSLQNPVDFKRTSLNN